MFLLKTSLLDDEVPLLIRMEVVKQMVSVIDVAEKAMLLEQYSRCGGANPR